MGRIVDFPRGNSTRLYDCPQCPEYRRKIKALEDAVKAHKAAHGASRSFAEEAAANLRLWEIINES